MTVYSHLNWDVMYGFSVHIKELWGSLKTDNDYEKTFDNR